jgi:hypothetical protein
MTLHSILYTVQGWAWRCTAGGTIVDHTVIADLREQLVLRIVFKAPYMLYIAYCLLCVGHDMLYTVYCTLCVVNGWVYTVYNVLYTLYSTLCTASVERTHENSSCARVWNVWCLVYGVWCMVYSIWGLGLGAGGWGLRVGGWRGVRFRCEGGVGCMVRRLWFDIQDLGLEAWGLGIRVLPEQTRENGWFQTRVPNPWALNPQPQTW